MTRWSIRRAFISRTSQPVLSETQTQRSVTTMQKNEKPVEDLEKVKRNPQGGKVFGQQLKVQVRLRFASNCYILYLLCNIKESDLDRIGSEYKRANPDADPAQIAKYKGKSLWCEFLSLKS